MKERGTLPIFLGLIVASCSDPSVCGNNTREAGEACDDGNEVTESCAYGQTSCLVCDALCQEVAGATSYCGDNIIDGDNGEACDDGDIDDGNGCSSSCQVESGWTCQPGSPSACSLISSCAEITEIPLVECQALVELYHGTDGANWGDNTDWLLTTTPCSWYGVTCSDGHVVELGLPRNLLAGEIPAELANLTSLTILELPINELTGEIPVELGNLSNLTELDLNANDLTGGIPAELGNLSNLTELRLVGNDLTGEIPAKLGSLSNLTELKLSFNDLTGEIPAELGNLSNLTGLTIMFNDLTGEVPAELGNLASLTMLDLQDNGLTGEIPGELGKLTRLTWLGLCRNQLTGEIPAELGNLASLTSLGLEDNGLTGEIPVELGNLTNLTELWMRFNQLTGGIPAELGNLTNLTVLKLASNRLTGKIPSELSNLTNLEDFELNDNELVGPIPANLINDGMSRLSVANLRDNLLDEEAVDAVLAQVYAARASFVRGPWLILGGTNDPPSGNYSNPNETPGIGASNTDWSWNGTCHDPLTGQAMAYALKTDNCREGFRVWNVRYDD